MSRIWKNNININSKTFIVFFFLIAIVVNVLLTLTLFQYAKYYDFSYTIEGLKTIPFDPQDIFASVANLW